ncbi:MAG: hypothetical protein PHG05_01880 [Candidatus Nanoarchaeia archaeon]|nr:hypothetical protein [Candidatus Nanoarchaeia archaeon]
MSKRGQVTLFIIIGIIIVVIVGLLLIFKGQIQKEITKTPEEFNQIPENIQNCLEMIGNDALYEVLFYGGQYPDIKNNVEGFAYLKDYTTIKEIEESLNKYVEYNIDYCVDLTGYEVERGNPAAEFTIDDKVNVNFRYPLKVIKDDKTYEIDEEYLAEFDARVYEMYNLGKIISEESKKPEFCISCIIDSATQKDLRVEVAELDKNTLIIIYDDSFMYDMESLKFVFAI